MPWKTPKTWTTGAVLTVWAMNTEIRDPLKTLRNLNDHAVHLSKSEHQSIPENEQVAVKWDVVDWMVGTEIWTSGDESQLKAPVPGWYELLLNYECDGSTGGSREQGYRINGDAPVYTLSYSEIAAAAGLPPVMVGMAVIQLTTADFVEAMFYHTLAEGQDLHGGGDDRSHVSWRLLGGAT